MEIRPATLDDLIIIADIYHQNVGRSPMITPILEPRPLEDWNKWFEDHPQDKYPAYILEINDKIVGWGAINSYSSLAAYCGIVSRSTYICETEHGKGYGTILRNHGREKAKELGYHTLISYVHEGNIPSMVMAEKEGMQLWAKFPKAATCGKDRWDFYIYGMSI
jgi:phosphinothricin acetyltransferase